VIYETDQKKIDKIIKGIQKQDKALEKYNTKGNLTMYVSTCLDQAHNYFKIYRKEQCIEKLNQAVAYCHEHPNLDLPGKSPFQLISYSTALGNEIEKLYDFYFGTYNKIQELYSKRVTYWSHCAFTETKEDVMRKSGTIIPIPFVVNIRKTRSYSDVFSHTGWVFGTNEGLTFLLLPSFITVSSSGPLVHNLNFYCMAPELTEFNLSWPEIENAYIVNHVYPKNKSVRIQAKQTNFDIVIYNYKPLEILNSSIGDHRELGIDNLVLRPSSAFSFLSITDSKGALQKGFKEMIDGMKGGRMG